jgi:hypothetical protein
LAERQLNLKQRLSAELVPQGLIQEIIVSTMANHAAGMELAAAAESATWEFAADNAKLIEVLGGATADKSTLIAAMGSEHVLRANRYRLQQERAFFNALRIWNGIKSPFANAPKVSLFADEDACVEYLARWQAGRPWVCGACGGRERWRLATRGKFECRCGQQQSVREGTLFARSHTPLLAWFDLTTALVIGPASKASEVAKQLRSVRLGTVRGMLKKVRAALAAPDAEQHLAGLPAHVERHLREVYAGGAQAPFSPSAGDDASAITDRRVFSGSVVGSPFPRRPR